MIRRRNKGETLVEALCALTVAAIAILMLAVAIATGRGIISIGDDALDDYYSGLASLETFNENCLEGTGTVSISGGTVTANGEEAGEMPGSDGDVGVSVYSVDLPGAKDTKAYKAS